jgi:hypothetical protein
VLNYVGDGFAYTYNVAGIFYTNLAPDIHNQVKAGGYLPPDAFTSNYAQVQELHVLRDLTFKAELEVAMIVAISKRDNGVYVNSYHTQGMTLSPWPANSYDWHSSSTPVMSATPALAKAPPPSTIFNTSPVP